MPLGPVCVAWVCWVVYQTAAYVPELNALLASWLVVLGAMAILMFICQEQIKILAKECIKVVETRILVRNFPRFSLLEFLFCAFFFVLLSLIFYQIFSLPFLENDSQEYVLVARHILSTGSLAAYPVTDTVLSGGLYAPSSHPPGYVMLLVWSFLTSGEDSLLQVRLTSAFHFVGLLILAFGLRHFRLREVAVAAFVMMTTPLVISMVVGYHVDGMRLMLFLAAVIWTALAIESCDLKVVTVAGAVAGFAAFSHSIGLLAIGFGGISILAFWRGRLVLRLLPAAVFGAVAVAVGGYQFVENTVVLGAPLMDAPPVFVDEAIGYTADLWARRDIDLWTDKIVYGVARAWFELSIFGLGYWAFLYLLVRNWLAGQINKDLIIILLWIFSFFALSVVTVLLGSELIIKNPRYALTTAPLVAIFVAGCLRSFRGRLQ